MSKFFSIFLWSSKNQILALCTGISRECWIIESTCSLTSVNLGRCPTGQKQHTIQDNNNNISTHKHWAVDQHDITDVISQISLTSMCLFTVKKLKLKNERSQFLLINKTTYTLAHFMFIIRFVFSIRYKHSSLSYIITSH